MQTEAQLLTIDRQSINGFKRIFLFPSVVIAWNMLTSYRRSGWLWAELIFVLALFGGFFFPFQGYVKYFYGVANQWLSVEAIIGTAFLANRTMKSKAYLTLARVPDRSSYIRGLALASVIVRILTFLMFIALVIIFRRLTDFSATTLIIGVPGLILNLTMLSALTIVLSAPLSSRRMFIVFLGWLAAMLYSNTSTGTVARWLSWTQLPLVPVTSVYGIGIDGIFSTFSILSIMLVVIYIFALLLLAQWLFKKKDLVLH